MAALAFVSAKPWSTFYGPIKDYETHFLAHFIDDKSLDQEE